MSLQPPPLRNVKSYVIRQGRMTLAQKAATTVLSKRYCIDIRNQSHLPFIFPDCQIHPLILEIGFGMGDALLQSAKENPQIFYLGIEVHPPGLGKALHEIEQSQLHNIRLIQGDAVEILKSFIPDHALAGINLFFPDPWPKMRHHKRRIVNHDFICLMTQKLCTKGFFHFATDWENYAEWVTEIMLKQSQLIYVGNERYGRPLTKFEQRGISLGHKIFDFYYLKKD